MAEQIDELPLFPLPDLVLFPGGSLPLHIFEQRYRQMVNSVLDGDAKFGVLNIDRARGAVSDVGCCAEILEVQRLPDGRMNILTEGRQRFRVLDMIQEKPYLVGKVELIDDEPTEADLDPLAADMEQILRDVVRLSAKLADKDVEFPNDLPTGPENLSFWVAGSFPGLPSLQQSLLEMRDTGARLQKEAEILGSARQQLAARAALKDAFADSKD